MGNGTTAPHPPNCRECGNKLRAAHYKAADYPGTVGYSGNGICKPCAAKERIRRVDPAYRTRGVGQRGSGTRRAAEVIEDWVLIRDRLGGRERMPVTHLIAEAARAMDMSYSALAKHLERARARGDDRARTTYAGRTYYDVA